MLYDPTSPYVQNAVMAFNRAKDKIIINAAFAPVWTGEHGDIQKTFPASNIIPHGDTGLTIEKLIQARGMLWRNEIDESEPLFAAVTSFQLEDMLNNTKVQSADYNTIKALVRGEINSFMGFTFIRTEQLERTARRVSASCGPSPVCSLLRRKTSPPRSLNVVTRTTPRRSTPKWTSVRCVWKTKRSCSCSARKVRNAVLQRCWKAEVQ